MAHSTCKSVNFLVVLVLSFYGVQRESAASTWVDVYQLSCPHVCTCSLPTAINCSSLTLIQLDLHIYLANASVHTNEVDSSLNDSARGVPYVYPSMELLDVSDNNLTDVRYITISSPSAPMNVSLFSIAVSRVDLSRNQLSGIAGQSFRTFSEVKELILSHNKIRNISATSLDGLETLVELDLSYNSISHISDHVWQALPNLQTLDLSYNSLQYLESLTILSSLKYLYLHNNDIHHMVGARQTLFTPLPALKHLDLSNNPVLKSAEGLFENSSRLESLYLSNCGLSNLENTIFSNMPLLLDLRLDHNNLSSIGSRIFQNTSLRLLTLASQSSLLNISHAAFEGLSQLVSLNISHNPGLSLIYPSLLQPLAELQVLDMSHCDISLLSSITFEHSPNLAHIYLTSNPLVCSCVNAWLASEAMLANNSRLENAGDLTCLNTTSGQSQVASETIFPCSDISLHNASSARLSVHLGGQLLLRCSHSAVEPGLVTWTIPGEVNLYHHDIYPEASAHLLSPHDVQPGAAYHQGHYWHASSSYHPELADRDDRIMVLSDGSLYIDYMLRTDAGRYTCKVSNAHYNQSSSVVILLDYKLSGEIKSFGIAVGLLCALGFFTLNIIYMITSWLARRLVNKRRRETIRQMLENMNAYKSTQIARIQENYTHQLGRVRTQYHTQRDRLHKNYTQQVTRVKGACSHQVERVRDNYTLRLAQLRDYSSNQVVLIRERANNQIVRIRDYGASQLDRLRETYKLQHLHVMKLLETMNLDNCRHIVETECMRAESMMFDVDILGEVERTDSPLSGVESEYTTPDCSPPTSLKDTKVISLSEDIIHGSSHSEDDVEAGINHWDREHSEPLMCSIETHTSTTKTEGSKESYPLPVVSLCDEESEERDTGQENGWGLTYMTPQASPKKTLSKPPDLTESDV